VSAVQAVARRLGRISATGSLGLRRHALLRRIVASTQDTRFGPFVTPQTFELAEDGGTLASGQREYDDGERFFGHFDGLLAPDDLQGKDVLDLGCGYGGRTVYYAERCGPRHVTGLEISAAMVSRCRELAIRKDVANVSFDLGFGEELPYEDDAFDVVLSYDVFEHVSDPVRALRELTRVLRPGGDAWLVFPSYLGARSSHLDYLTHVPLLHRLFDPDVIVEVVNELLAADPARYGVAQQPPPRVGALGRISLPTLNGMSRGEAVALAARGDAQLVSLSTAPIVTAAAPVPFARPAAAVLDRWAARDDMPESLVGHVAMHLIATEG
jgi:SAM-dependent methyltransferase